MDLSQKQDFRLIICDAVSNVIFPIKLMTLILKYYMNYLETPGVMCVISVQNFIWHHELRSLHAVWFRTLMVIGGMAYIVQR